MPDREKVIKGLKCCAHTDGTNCVYCPYDNADEDCTALMSMDVLDLLKEQEAVKPKYKERIGGFVAGICPTCGTALNNILNVKACGKCGQRVKWE